MIRSIFIASVFSLFAPVCIAQSDSTRSSMPSTQPAVQIPGIDTPLSGPGTLLQSSPNPNMEPVPQRKDKKRRRTSPPSNPRAFGVSIPLGGAKKDTLN